jgi:hypothetical protein
VINIALEWLDLQGLWLNLIKQNKGGAALLLFCWNEEKEEESGVRDNGWVFYLFYELSGFNLFNYVN